jgi:hypothetical protein
MKTFREHAEERGYIALMATIIIAAVLLVMSVEGSIAGWHARFNVLGTEAKEQATALAQGCADQALSAIMTNPAYTGGATTTTDVGTCYVFPLQFNFPAEGVVTIKTQAVVRDSYSNLEMQMDMDKIHIDAIPEAPTQGTLVIITNVVNDGSGTQSADDFTMLVAGGNPSETSFAGNESGEIVTVDPGSYAVNGDTLSGYARSVSTNCSGNITQGEVRFCTVTYNDITTTLTVLVNVINDNGGDLEYTDFPVYIDGDEVTAGEILNVTSGAHTASADTVTGYTASVWGYQCSSDGSVTVNEGQNKTCIINFNDNPPPTPSCADTVMMLDRSGSMFPSYGGSSSDIPNEKAAAKSLVSLYSTVTPIPKIGVGRFGDVASGISAEIIAQLTNVYTSLASIIDNGLPENPLSYTNLKAAITVGSDELNSSRHSPGKEKVLIIVSDGDPNRPTGSTNYDTGFRSSSGSSNESGSSYWNISEGAYADGGSDAYAGIGANSNYERYLNFNVEGGAGLPSGASVSGIEVRLDAWATAGTVQTPGNSQRSPSSLGTPSQWTNGSRTYASDNSYATDAVNGHTQVVDDFGLSIPSNATITGVEVTTEAMVQATTPTTTSTLYPSAQGYYTAWTNEVTTIDEVGTPDCGSTDSIIESTANDRESVTINLSSIPNGATITDVTITAYDRADASTGGTYKTFARLNGTNTDAPSNLTASSNSGCTQKTQTIDFSNAVKNSGTTLEIGVVKVGEFWQSPARNTVRVGALRVVVSYIPAVSGALNVALSSNNGSSYTGEKAVALTTAESVLTPAGNSATDMWGRTWTPNDFNNGNFALRMTNTSQTGVTVSLDRVLVTVHYTVPVTSGTACQIDVDLSWNGGVSWTGAKSRSLSSAETSVTLGASNDDWRSGSWSPTDFSNANFRARVRAADPGSNCDASAFAHLDWLQLRVYYTKTADPVQDALTAADVAKLAGTDIFTIHFGSDPSGYNGRELLANLASGNTTVSGHEKGSAFDQSATPTSGNTGFVSPTQQLADTGGDNNGYESYPERALTDGNGNASNVNGAGDRHRFSGYNFTVPPNSTIAGIETRLDWWTESTSGNNSMNVELSWNGGTSWTSAKNLNNESTNSSNSGTLGNTSDTWGHTWTADELLPANFRVRVTSNCSGNANPSCSGRDFYLDWIPVRVSYTGAIPENGDGDNFFISPTSADMDNIFDFIGEQVCPALGFAEASDPPTTGKVNVVTNVINNNGGSLTASAVSVSVSPSSASPNSFVGSASGVLVTFNPGSYTVSGSVPDGYVEVVGAGCTSLGNSGDITAGESRVCVLTYDDIPPPPPPPELTIHLDTWKELPVAE